MSCERALQTQAYLDGELDSLASVEIEQHIESCAECAALRDAVTVLRKDIRGQASYYRADAKLRNHIGAALDHESAPPKATAKPPAIAPSRPFWNGAFSGAAAMALAATLVFFIFAPAAQDQIANDVAAAHLRSLMGNHLIDVASSNRHTVKPWFDGHVDIAPPVADYGDQGFDLIGGRVDYVDGQRAAVVVYRHGKHIVNVFAWKNDGKASSGMKTRDGYHLLAWQGGDLFYCAISDMAPGELEALSHLIQKTAQG